MSDKPTIEPEALTADEEGNVLQRDLFDLLGFKPAQWKKIREERLFSKDWFKVGKSIWIRRSGMERLCILSEEPKFAQRKVTVYGRRLPANKSHILVREDMGKGEVYKCVIPRRLKRERLMNKPFEAEKVEINGKPAYRHHSLIDPNKP